MIYCHCNTIQYCILIYYPRVDEVPANTIGACICHNDYIKQYNIYRMTY